eukprot:m.1057553 g.1057553  ORF g.1057553 m.1057553 type:complete len:211 (-) comp24205_c0_seq31:1103-1735(-)
MSSNCARRSAHSSRRSAMMAESATRAASYCPTIADSSLRRVSCRSRCWSSSVCRTSDDSIARDTRAAALVICACAACAPRTGASGCSQQPYERASDQQQQQHLANSQSRLYQSTKQPWIPQCVCPLYRADYLTLTRRAHARHARYLHRVGKLTFRCFCLLLPLQCTLLRCAQVLLQLQHFIAVSFAVRCYQILCGNCKFVFQLVDFALEF